MDEDDIQVSIVLDSGMSNDDFDRNEEEKKEEVSNDDTFSNPDEELFRYRPEMPLLKDCADMDIEEVFYWISKVPQSRFHNADLNLIYRALSFNEARRYLAKLIIINQ